MGLAPLSSILPALSWAGLGPVVVRRYHQPADSGGVVGTGWSAEPKSISIIARKLNAITLSHLDHLTSGGWYGPLPPVCVGLNAATYGTALHSSQAHYVIDALLFLRDCDGPS
ncbi:hypothetical protein BP5796_08599 [Coleophoma crateriformis]|uniref:FAD linked oxidase N-terminal domain-containing protein n=1 Tax=Coleophoma crateriformis TaxID=565419 RepID=A0A3D8R822_9HELO|nr:hypothetical protein BP5796_08599 [Coleophoma crateriformis]